MDSPYSARCRLCRSGETSPTDELVGGLPMGEVTEVFDRTP
ncbi:hypothetical protein BH18ACT1_BH18ACT1_19480 [soil metagenome]